MTIPLSPKVAAPLFFTVGVVLSLITLFVFLDVRDFVSGAEASTGTVIEYTSEEQREDDGSITTFYQPVIVFDVDGQKQSFASGLKSTNKAFTVGETVPILYTPTNPADAEINTFGRLYGLIIVQLILSIAFLAAGIGTYIYHKHTRTN